MGEVFLAEDRSLDRRVAIKFVSRWLQDDPVAHERLRREAKAAAALDHPYICKIYEITQVDGKTGIVMEYVSGESLLDALVKRSLTTARVLELAAEIAEALDEAHSRGIVHRDLKPSNFMLTAQGHVKVMDFGMARRLLQTEGGRQGGRHGRLHGARAAPRAGGGPAVRHLLVRRVAVRAAHRRAPVSASAPGRHHRSDPPPAAGLAAARDASPRRLRLVRPAAGEGGGRPAPDIHGGAGRVPAAERSRGREDRRSGWVRPWSVCSADRAVDAVCRS